ncbi:hypothetical protein A5724_26940 [Mycobacterium sp. ACS1612]|uniref:hypothetical protein n=1 Tax=Mycobacterium sp. ACS1612 TaxID=1834117 RepID=UPI0007FFCA5D|nr:hypothetical protein [Mycobacterium sp. ACS1612]OBF29113.1 hypothetical protein A5724_26940 [Mycobacterium sp. ACS1612]
MRFDPVLPPALLGAIAFALIALRLITMYQLHTSAGARWGTVWRWCGLTLAVMLVMIAAMRPSLATDGQQTAASAPGGENVNVFLVVDRSPEAGVTDYGDASRMDGIRADINGLLARYPHARFAVIVFSSRASLNWPLSEDVWSLQPVIARLAPYNEPDGESTADAGAAANVLRYQLIAAGQQYRDSANLVFYFGSGVSGSSVPQGEFQPVAGTVDGGAVLGYGGPPTFDQARLQLVAEQLGVPYVHRQAGEPLPQTTVTSNPAGTQSNTVLVAAAPTELYWVFTLPASVLLLFELFLTVRELRRTRTTAW